MSDADDDEERTDPNIQLPELAPLQSMGGLANEEHTLDMDPLPPPPRHPNRPAPAADADVEGPATDRPASSGATPPPLPARHRVASAPPSTAPDPRSALPPAARLPSVPSGAIARPIPPARPLPSERLAPSSPDRLSALERASAATRSARISNPPPPRRDSRPPPPLRPGSIPPARMPKPSDPPPARAELNPPQRQRLAQMETHLDGARSTIARQRNEIDELRARLEAREARLDGLAAQISGAPSQETIDRRVSELEQRRDAIASELRARMEHAEREVDGRDGRFGGIEARIDRLEEDGDTVRLRMRQETMNHRLTRIDARLGAYEEALSDLRRSLAEAQARDHRLERLEALFDEFHAELVEQRARTGADALSQRMDDLEALVIKSGAAIDERRDTLAAQLARVEKISESLPPPALAALTSGDDLTRIKGIGPKFARLLAAAGVTTFAEIAAWDEVELKRVAAAVGVKPSRITKAGWVESAASLAGA